MASEAGPSAANGLADEAPGPSTVVDDAAGPSTVVTEEDADELLKLFFSDLKDVDRDNEVNRILWAFKLNPFEKLNLRFDATLEDVRKAYRKLSLMVHPDKCSHPKASDAFDILGAAQKELMGDDQRENLMKKLEIARDEVRQARKKETKHDNAVKLATLLHEGGREAVEAEWEKTEEFHERWKEKARDVLARLEWRKRKLGKRLKEETLRLEAKDEEAKEVAKTKKEQAKEWEKTREQRVSTWHDYQKSKSGKKTVGMLQPPKLKTNDEDRLYVQRAVVHEEFRPGQPKPGGKT